MTDEEQAAAPRAKRDQLAADKHELEPSRAQIVLGSIAAAVLVAGFIAVAIPILALEAICGIPVVIGKDRI